VSETVVYLVRHAHAGARARWEGPDRLRPLDDVGRAQAQALVGLLAGQPFVHLVSSPYARCIGTMVPLALARGMVVEVREELAEGTLWELAEKIVLEAAAEGPAAVCVHGDVMQELVADLGERGVPLSGDVAKHAKGATWILGVTDGVIASARYLPAPARP
jgi:broad specificity phosphatase PhoE